MGFYSSKPILFHKMKELEVTVDSIRTTFELVAVQKALQRADNEIVDNRNISVVIILAFERMLLKSVHLRDIFIMSVAFTGLGADSTTVLGFLTLDTLSSIMMLTQS
mmetsp:Transcript_3694/g.5228  ORF Transcript_3694/g.5228 Transcript_3694/m.5228 type:complete len:107 (+) Transcript_3694:904-1224(+)